MTAESNLACVHLRHELKVTSVFMTCAAEYLYNYRFQRYANGLNYPSSAFTTGRGTPAEDLPEPRYGLRREGPALHRERGIEEHRGPV